VTPSAEGPAPDQDLDDLLVRAVQAAAGVDARDLRTIVPIAIEPLPELSAPGRDELRRLTILFSDLAGSTDLSARLDPEDYRRLIALHTDSCRRAIEDENDGFVVHTRGDGVLAVFGFPAAHEDDPLRAVRAGLSIHAHLDAASGGRTAALVGRPLVARVGIHRGLVYVDPDEPDVHGYAVNVAARLQDAARGGTVVLSDEVRRLAGDSVLTEDLGPSELRGVADPVRLHRALQIRPRRAGKPGRKAPLVGREEQLAWLRERHRAAGDAEHPIASLVAGEPGIGKSRLVEAHLDELTRAVPVLELSGSALERQGLHPLRDLLHDWAGLADQPPAARLAALRVLLDKLGVVDRLAELAPVAGIGPEAGYAPIEAEPRKLEARIGDAVHELLAAWCGQGPAVLVIEDLHWVDPATLAVLERLLDAGPGRLHVIATTRDPSLLAGPHTERTVLEALPPDVCRLLVASLRSGLDPAGVTDVVEQSDGIPLFVEELAQAAGSAAPDGHDPGGQATSVPAPLHDPLQARLNELGGQRPVLSAAATIGRTVPLELLAAATELDPEELDDAVRALVEHGVLESDHGDGRRVRFRHELVRRAAYEMAVPSGRRRLHRAVADAIVGRAPADVDWVLVASHERQGGRPLAAVEALRHAAADALRRGSIEEARQRLDDALDVLAEVAPGSDRDRCEVDVRLRRAFLAVSAEGFGSVHAAADYRRCLELSVDDPAGEELYETLIALWGHYVNQSDLSRAHRVSTALRSLSQGVRSPMLPTNRASFGIIAWYRGSFTEAATQLAGAVEAIHELGVDASSTPPSWTMPLDPVASMHVHDALAQHTVGDLLTAEQQLASALGRCATLPFPYGPFTEAYVRLLSTWMLVEPDETDLALRAVRRAAELADRHGFDAWQFWASMVTSPLEALLDPGADPLAVAEQVSTMLEMWHALGVLVLSGSIQNLAARMLLAAGQQELAAARAAEAIATAAATGSVAFLAETHRLAALAGPGREAESGLLRSWSHATDHGDATTAVRAARDLVRLAGSAHHGRLEAALELVRAPDGHPLVISARELLAPA
jgi:class 3 adenylate cyclase